MAAVTSASQILQLGSSPRILHTFQTFLDIPVVIGPRAAPACLPTSNLGSDFLDGRTMTVSGWGATSQGGAQPTVLHSVDVPGITNARCSQHYTGITNAMLCAGDVTNGGIDSCQGDSGGNE